MNQKWINEGGIFFPISGDFILHPTPGPGIFRVEKSPKPMDPRIGLNKLSDKFEFDYKIYTLGHEGICERVKQLWNNKEFEATSKNLGVIFNGLKGTG